MLLRVEPVPDEAFRACAALAEAVLPPTRTNVLFVVACVFLAAAVAV